MHIGLDPVIDDELTRYQNGQYWCEVKKENGKLIGYVGSSGSGNQRVKSMPFSVARPVSSDDLIAIYFEWLTNDRLYQDNSRRSYRFVLSVLKTLLTPYKQKVWSLPYRNRPASLRLTDDRYIQFHVKGEHPLTIILDHWSPNKLEASVFYPNS